MFYRYCTGDHVFSLLHWRSHVFAIALAELVTSLLLMLNQKDSTLKKSSLHKTAKHKTATSEVFFHLSSTQYSVFTKHCTLQ